MTFKPMLAADGDVNRLVTTDERRPGFDRDDAWCYQQKYNGDRVLVAITLGQVDVFGRDGQRSQWKHKFATRAHQAAYATLADLGVHMVVLDGELITETGVMWVFDIVTLESGAPPRVPAVLGSDPYRRRLRALTDLFEQWAPPETLFRLAPTAIGTVAKLELALDCVRRCTEGVIARKLDGTYQPGARSTRMLKLKFIHDADLVVMAIGFEGRDNVVLGAYTPEGKLIEVGRASAHGKGSFATDDVVVVRYNYMSRDGRLVGPRILRKRTDKPAIECSTEQLFYSQEVPVYEH